MGSLRQNPRNLTASLLAEICKNVDVELQLLPTRDKTFNNQIANATNKVRVNRHTIKGIFQQAFFDVEVTQKPIGIPTKH